MRFVLAMVLILLVAPFAPARAETELPEKELRPTIVQTQVEAEAPAQPAMELTEVKLPEQKEAVSETAATQDMPRRGSFWWLVGVIVVAGVILVVLLD